MGERRLPRYPVFVPSRGRYDTALTAKFFLADGVPFRLVVVPSEAADYTARFGSDCVLVLPDDDMVLRDSRNWIKDFATAEGHARHWQFDDNIRRMRRRYRAKRIRCRSGPVLAAMEDFVDRYGNVAIAGPNYDTFVMDRTRQPPFVTNCHVYSASLILNAIPHRWRLVYNDDTDMCLQVLADGWCTVLFNAFMVVKAQTMTVSGGNTGQLYQGDGRLRMARALERMWPGVVRTDRRWQRPQHVVDWKKFDTPLKLRAGVDLSKLPRVGDYGMRLRQVAPEVKSPLLRRFLAEQPADE